MPYIGRSNDKISNIEVLDNITFDGSSSYSITKGSVAFTPNSAQSCLISIDGVVQATNFTVSSSTIDFGVAIPSTSVCNFFLHYGTGVMTVPSDGSVTTAKLGDGSVTSAKLNSGVALGKVLQVQTSFTCTSSVNTTNTSYTDTGYSVAITPSATTSKILLYFQSTIQSSGGRNSLTFNRSGYGDLHGDISSANNIVNYENTSPNGNSTANMMYIDSPSTTSAITYKVRFKTSGSNTIYLGGHDSSAQILFAMEIAQ